MRKPWVIILRIALLILGAVNAGGVWVWWALDTRFALVHGVIAAACAVTLLLWHPQQPAPQFPEYMAETYRRAR
jgi:membrane protein YdbS with pleckstrin-like domain